MNAKVINLAHPNHLLHDEYAFLGIFMTDFFVERYRSNCTKNGTNGG